ncbi:MAG: 4-hydroxythreonine-4-phosphate dehydrogenase PdxA [Bullifex sp.]
MIRYIALPMGEAGGVSPEMIIKALSTENPAEYGGVIVVGDLRLFRKVSRDIRVPLSFTAYVESDEELAESQSAGENCIFYDLPLIDMEAFEYGKISANTGRATYASTAKAVQLIQDSFAFALVTPPLDARSIAMAGFDECRYITMIPEFCSSGRGITMLDSAGVKIFSHTHHIPLRKALDEITYEKILDTIIRVDSLTQTSTVFDNSKPLAIASVNPHHADSLSYEAEESEVLIPAINAAKEIGIDIIGPVSSDHLMHRAKKGLYRAVIALFHDQAHVAAMSFDFEHTVTVTWGWPFIAVGVDRGAMLERAGKNMMKPYNLIQALHIACQYIRTGVNS